jgi:nitroreductase
MADLFDVIHRQRACRDFSDEDVDDALVEKMLDAATFAPSAENKQPWVFIVVRDEERRERIAELTRRMWEGGARQYEEQHLDARILADVDRAVQTGFAKAPVTIVACGDHRDAFESTLPSSVFPAVQNILLAATALGLGTVLTTLATAFADDLSQLLELPEKVQPMAVVFAGWPAKPLGPPKRVPFSEKSHRDGFGRGW